MDTVDIERIGGVAGFGGPHLKALGQVDSSKLAEADRRVLDELFANPPTDKTPDEFCYRLSRQTRSGPQTVVVPARHVPQSLQSSVKDVLS